MDKHLIYGRGSKAEQWRKLEIFQLMILEQLGIHTGKLKLVSYFTQYTNNNYGWIRKLNVKDNAIKI